MKTHLPDFEQSISNLRAHGEQFPAGTRILSAIGNAGLQADLGVLGETGQLYTNDTISHQSLTHAGLQVAPAAPAVATVAAAMDRGLVWGFSGYATEGPSYQAEADGLQLLHETLKDIGEQPAMTIDGGCSAGVLGLNGLLAARHHIPTLGIIPRRGLDSVGVRDHMLIAGLSYRDREVFVGTIPDVLVCIGGAAGTEREYATALRAGSTVLLLMLRDYPPTSLAHTYSAVPETAQALADERLFVCNTPQAITDNAEQALDAARRTALPRRPERLKTVRGLL